MNLNNIQVIKHVLQEENIEIFSSSDFNAVNIYILNCHYYYRLIKNKKNIL